jgi:hypothetical protein
MHDGSRHLHVHRPHPLRPNADVRGGPGRGGPRPVLGLGHHRPGGGGLRAGVRRLDGGGACGRGGVLHGRPGAVAAVAAAARGVARADLHDHLLRSRQRDPPRRPATGAGRRGPGDAHARRADHGRGRPDRRRPRGHGGAALRRPPGPGRGDGRGGRPAARPRGGGRGPRRRYPGRRQAGRDDLGGHLLQLLRHQEPAHRRGWHGHHRRRRAGRLRAAQPAPRHEP